MSWKIYHNPRCSKSRETLGILEKNGISVDVIEYLKAPPSLEELLNLIELLGSSSILVRTKEDAYKDAPFDIDSPQTVAKKLVENPSLMERPVVVNEAVAIIGRPPEKVLEIIA